MIENIKERFHQLQSNNGTSPLTPIERNAFDVFSQMGIPTVKHEEWKYTRISGLFNKEFQFVAGEQTTSITRADLESFRLPGYEDSNELVFVNGLYSAQLSHIRSSELVLLSLDEAMDSDHAAIVSKYLGGSNKYVKDGIHALNTAFLQQGIYLNIRKGKILEHPIYIYNITDARVANTFAQPRTLVYVSENAQVQMVETYGTIGSCESFTNQVLEVVVDTAAIVDYYKIQNDQVHANQVSTINFRQIGKSLVNAVTISLNGNIVRNNLSIALEAEYCESHLFGLYFLRGKSHVDNHTVVDHVKPNCMSNELYKGIINDNGTAVFNGKIFVQPQAQKTNAYQTNKNILLSDSATVNTKPQLEIFADDVKCSHGCTVGQLDDEGLFYLRSRGINESTAKAMLVHAFAIDILEYIKPAGLRAFVDQLISEQLQLV